MTNMDTDREDGGDAFPGAFWPTPQSDAPDYRPGMSLRDWFASQSLAVIANDSDFALRLGHPVTVEDLAHAAYAFADAMLQERVKP